MLDTDTKRRIDTARDILVGKVPDPKSQVEQITIALIYKFMDDMDAGAEELGGHRKFFAGEYARYGWAKLMRSGLGGHETLNLYAEAIAKMPENPGIPPLFRDIFKNAYLPYRDPETLRAFLKIIDEFAYDHSERLGDAFEYLLSVLGSQGDAGQFRTPRHIIDFMVEVVDPRKTDVILDPACGTAGFLISAYKHIRKANTDKDGHSTLTPDERGRLANNMRGYDIDPKMVQLSLSNMYLHGFTDPHIHEYDTLTYQDRWNEYADVILANPPFMSPKGGIKPHNRFSVQSKRSEVLFVDYMAEHLTPNGRAGIIVPEGIIFQSQTAYTQLRKLLVEEYLVAVVSLPAGVFNPYAGVKTSILILDKTLARQTQTIAFFKIEKDGYGLGAQRRALCTEMGDKPELCPKHSDLPQTRAEIAEYLRRLRAREPMTEYTPTLGLVVSKEKIAANGDYNLSGERYREGVVSNTAYPLVPVGRFMKDGVKTVDPRTAPDELFELWSIPAFDAGRPEILRGTEVGSQKKVVAPGDVLLSRIIPHIRRAWVVHENSDGRRQIASTEWIVFSSADIAPGFLRQLLVSDFFHASFMQTITGVGGSLSRANPGAVAEIQIPLPPLPIQQEIVAEIEGYQKVIDGARAVLDNYRPHIPIRPEWPMVELGEIVVELESGVSVNSTNRTVSDGEFGILKTSCVTSGVFDSAEHKSVLPEEHSRLRCPVRGNTIIISRMNTEALVGANAFVPQDYPNLFLPDRLWQTVISRADVEVRYVQTVLASKECRERISSLCGGTSGSMKNISKPQLLSLRIPLPPLETQRAIVAEIEAEQALVAANRDLIARMEKKIQATLARVWGEDAQGNTP
ncbi:MAG: restriction endonuclease subunit M/S [Lentisphaerae bacterium]|nr:restriction endonuclease subunit M/S [Lentisphaerota bacterium]